MSIYVSRSNQQQEVYAVDEDLHDRNILQSVATDSFILPCVYMLIEIYSPVAMQVSGLHILWISAACSALCNEVLLLTFCTACCLLCTASPVLQPTTCHAHKLSREHCPYHCGGSSECCVSQTLLHTHTASP